MEEKSVAYSKTPEHLVYRKMLLVRTAAHVRNVWRNHSGADSGEQLF